MPSFSWWTRQSPEAGSGFAKTVELTTVNKTLGEEQRHFHTSHLEDKYPHKKGDGPWEVEGGGLNFRDPVKNRMSTGPVVRRPMSPLASVSYQVSHLALSLHLFLALSSHL